MKIPVRRFQFLILFVFAALAVFLWYCAFFAPRGILTVAFLDVGQGDAILITAPNGNQALIDGGPPSGKTLSELGAVMGFFDRYIDAVIATHPDQDHIGGLPEVFRRYRVGAFLETGLFSDNGAYQAMERSAEAGGAKKILARAGEKISLDKNVTLEILSPDKNFPPGADANMSSVTVKLVYGSVSFLLTGDLPQEKENELVAAYGAALHADVLKFGHHGSKTSTSPQFLRAVSPEFGIISVGAENTYGHPNEETLARAKQSGVAVLRTDTQGRIVCRADKEKVLCGQ